MEDGFRQWWEDYNKRVDYVLDAALAMSAWCASKASVQQRYDKIAADIDGAADLAEKHDGFVVNETLRNWARQLRHTA